MVEKVARFATLSTHGSTAAAAILSHGTTDGRICGNSLEESDCCKVTDIAKALDTSQLKGKPKVMGKKTDID